MKHLLIGILVFVSSENYCQQYANVVPDPSIEGFEGNCYLGALQFNIDSSFYWNNGNDASTDYFGHCVGTNGWLTAWPYISECFQTPRSGFGMAGIANYLTRTTHINYREYLQTKLLLPLVPGKRYVGEYYLNLAEAGKTYCVNNMGMLLTVSKPNADSIFSGITGQMEKLGIINQIPQILSDTTYNIVDTLGWIVVRDTFVAQGGEEWLTIGNFRDNAHTIAFETNIAPIAFDSMNYYFVDDVSLYCIDSGAPIVSPNAFMQLGYNRKCQSDTVFLLDASSGSPDNWQWSATGGNINSSSQQNTFAIFTNPGTYTIQLIVSKSNGTSDTTQKTITIDPFPTINLSSSSMTVCAGWHVQLTASGTSSYTWSMGGSTAPNRIVSPTATTTYSVVGMNAVSHCLSDTESITIQVIQGPTFNLTADTLCATQSAITLSAQPPGGIYSGAGITGNQFDPQVAGNGTHQLVYNFTNSSYPNCIGSDTTFITVENCPIGMQEYSSDEYFIIYPNPANTEITIETTEPKEKEIVACLMFNLNGKLISTTEIPTHSKSITISVKDLDNGVYICKLLTNGLTKTMKRLVIIK